MAREVLFSLSRRIPEMSFAFAGVISQEPGDFSAQVASVFAQTAALLKTEKLEKRHMISVTVAIVADSKELFQERFAKFSELWAEWLNDEEVSDKELPCRMTVSAPFFLAKDALFEMRVDIAGRYRVPGE